MKTAQRCPSRIPTVMTIFGGLYAYIYCMLASQTLVDMPIFGGALFMCGRVATVFYATYAGAAGSHLPPRAKGWRMALLVLLLLLNLFLVVLYPIRLDSPMLWILFALVLTMMVRDTLNHKLAQLSVYGGMEEKRFMMLLSLQQAVPLLVMLVIFLYNLPAVTGWFMLGGYALCNAVELYGLLKERESMRTMAVAGDGEEIRQMQSSLRKTNAYTTYETLSTMILVALVMTLVVLYTFLAVTAEQLLIYMVLAVLCTLSAREAAEWVLRRLDKRGKKADPTQMMLIGLFLWLYGLMIFGRMLRTETLQIVNVYVCLGLCSAGSTLCLTCLGQMEQTMAGVARFAAGGNTPGYQQMRLAALDFATLLGQMLALAALTVMCFVTGRDLPHDGAELAARFQPLLVLPAVLTVIGAVLGVLRFPISRAYMEKLSRFLHLQDAGNDNPALRRQLEAVVVQRRSQPFFTRALMALLRPFYRHTLKDVENIVEDIDNPIVFLCNHGEVYGPLASILFMPVPVRPWTMSELSINKEESAAYLYKYTFSPIKWLPVSIRQWLARVVGGLSVYVFNQVECIPVFRNHPRQLMDTFRRSVEDMQAGDNLLIFPENPDAIPDKPGYERSGVGELFRGFAMLAPVYYNKTGKCCRFQPMYAHKGMRTLSFGKTVEFDPDRSPIEERDRIVNAVTAEMQRLSDREDALYQAKRSKSVSL